MTELLTSRSDALDRLSRLAAALMDAPIAHVTLVSGDRQFYRGSHGLPEEVISPDGLPLSFGFCPTVVATEAPLRRGDLVDSEFRDNPAVVEHGARAYAGTPLRAPDGTVVGSLCVVDMTARHWAEDRLELLDELASSVMTEFELVAALLQAERRADAARVIRHLHEGVVLLDRQRCVRLWNPAVEQLTDIPASAAIDRSIDDVLEGWPQAGSEATTLHLDGADGSRALEVSGVTWDAGSVFAVRDVTAGEKLASMRDELVATISHELRTPLASIYAASITMQRDDLTLDAAVRVRLLAMVEEQATRLTELCDSVLLASRLDHGVAPSRRRAVDLHALVHDVAAAIEVTPERARRLAIDAEHGVVALGDLAALRRVLENLIDNAFKYSPDDATVLVSAKQSGPGAVSLVIEDDGDGIPLAERDLVFEKFYRCDPHMRTGVGGTGLGLHISRALVLAMGGRLRVDDAGGGRSGAAMHVELVASG